MLSHRNVLPLTLLTLAAQAWSQEEASWDPLDSETVTRWDWELPVEVWRPLGSSLQLAGEVFAVAASERMLEVDTDGDGRADTRIRRDEGLITLDTKSLGAPYSVRVRREGEGWSWAPGSMLSARVRGTKIRLLDLDGDGWHGTVGADAILIGRHEQAGLVSDVVSIEGALVELEIEEGAAGPRLRTSDYRGAVAHLGAREEFESGGVLASAIFRSGKTYIDVASTRRPLLVPAGIYELHLGLVTRGARRARIGPGHFQPINLVEGDRHQVHWGGGLHADFTYVLHGDRLTVNPDVRFYDQAGAEYREFAPIAQAPTIRVRSAKTGNLVQFGKLGGCCGGGYTAWHATVPAGLELVVELEHERILFGKIRGTGRALERR